MASIFRTRLQGLLHSLRILASRFRRFCLTVAATTARIATTTSKMETDKLWQQFSRHSGGERSARVGFGQFGAGTIPRTATGRTRAWDRALSEALMRLAGGPPF